MQHRWNLKAPPRSRFHDVSKYLMKAFLMDSHLRLGAATFASIKFQKGHSSISPVKIFIIEVEEFGSGGERRFWRRRRANPTELSHSNNFSLLQS
jgi:hypothetical protein